MTAASNLGSIIAATADPAKPMFIGMDFDGAETRLTAGDLGARADAVARGLLARGLARGDRIGLLSSNRLDYIAAVLGAMRAGITAVPINTKFPASTIAYILGDSALSLVFAEAEALPLLAGTQVPVVSFDGPDAGFDALLDPGPFEAVTPLPEEVALILYTSGSTGRPKGVRLSHASHRWVAETRVAEYGLGQEVVLIAAPLYHMNALALAFLVCASGSTAVLLPQFRAVPYIDAIDRYRCSWLTAVPPMIAMMLREKARLETADLSCVRTIRMGSAPVNDSLIEETRALLPNARIINAYGTTEGGPVVFRDHPDGLPRPSGALGVPHAEVALRLADGETPDQGTLQIRSPGMMMGYNDPEKTRKAMTADGFYDTGDVFRRDAQGFYYFVGRADDMFVSGGENIFPGEVEAVIEEMDEVLQSCVVPVADAIKGTKPVAFVVARPGSGLDEAAVKRHVLAHAPAYQHPRRVWFEDRLLLGPTNKIDRNGLRALAEARLAEEQAGGPAKAAG